MKDTTKQKFNSEKSVIKKDMFVSEETYDYIEELKMKLDEILKILSEISKSKNLLFFSNKNNINKEKVKLFLTDLEFILTLQQKK